MAYDSTRGVTVLFGGSRQGSFDNVIDNDETWEWDGSIWTRRNVAGPSPRDGHRMAFDAARGVTVLFGGESDQGCRFADTWEWDGNAWNQRMASGPSPRAGSGMAYDPGRGRITLFGGASPDGNAAGYTTEGNRADTWEWDGTSWTVLDDYPTQRSEHAWAYDSTRHVTVLFGGLNGAVSNAETWEWDGDAWAHREVSGPSERHAHAMAYDAARGVIVLFGGSLGATVEGETWEWDGKSWTQRQVSEPSPRCLHAMAYDPKRHVTVLFGGQSPGGVLLGETWEWDGTAWTQRNVPGPTARRGHAMTYDAARQVIVMEGGETTCCLDAAIWEWDGAAWTQRQGAEVGREFHALAFDADRGVDMIFGGDMGILDDQTWEWDGAHLGTWTHRTLIGPWRRINHTMVFDAARHETLLLGGTLGGDGPYDPTNYYKVSGEMWALSGTCPVLSIAEQPQDRSVCAGQLSPVSIVADEASNYQWQARTPSTYWHVLTGTPASLPCGGSVNATPSNASTVNIGINACPGVNHYLIRCAVSTAWGSAVSAQATWTINTADFNGDKDIATDADIEAFFACLAGNCCAACGSADFDGDGVPATDADVEAFFRVIAGGAC
jgi:hypothetical protein